MTSLLLIGSTGLVGSEILKLALADPRVSRVVALTRRPLAAHPKLENPVVDFQHLPGDAPWWAVDCVVSAFGTTIKTAGSKAAFRSIDFGHPLEVCRLAHGAGAAACVLVSAMGASAKSPIFYSRSKGELEEAVAACGYPSLTILRPGFLGGERAESRPGEKAALVVMTAIGPVLPPSYRVVPAVRVATTAMEAALAAPAGQRVIGSGAILRGMRVF